MMINKRLIGTVPESRKYVAGFTDTFEVDRKNPRIEIELEELV